MAEERDVEEALRKRYWLKSNFEWFMNEVTFYKEMSKNFSDRKLVLWKYGEPEGKAELVDETSF